MLINHKSSIKEKAKVATKADAMRIALEEATPEQISNWVDNNVVNLTDVNKIIKFLLLELQSRQ